mgnify:CR=1 FL=1
MFYISSIKRFLLLAVLSVIVIAWTLSAVFNFYSSREQVEELFDAELAQMSRILQSVMMNHIRSSSEVYSATLDYLGKELLAETFGHQEFTELGHKYEKKLAFQVWDSEGRLFFENYSSLPKKFKTLKPGYEDINADGLHWRIFTLKDADFGFWIRTAQREDVRTELTSEISINTIMPNLIMLPVLVFLIVLLIRKGLSPLQQVSHALKKRGYQNLEQIPASDYPVELAYLVDELNDLFNRLSEASERERRFTADAAHELRTPLSISKVHLQNIFQISPSGQVKDFVDKALVGIDRLIHMVQQLLILSRLDAQQEPVASTEINVSSMINDILSDLKHQSILLNKSISFDNKQEIKWLGHDLQMRILLRNLLDNACRYAQDHTQISLFLDDRHLVVRNVCTAISEEMLSLCLERFKRGVSNQQGSGLGLSICQQICRQNAYSLSMINRTDGVEGIEVSISIR